MSMQITVDPAKLTQKQREFIAEFFLGYPEGTHVETFTATTEAIEKMSPESAFGQSKPQCDQKELTDTSVIGGVELDSKGFPWDGRIHAESKAKVTDGTWRKRRGLDASILAKVEVELKTVMAAPTPTQDAPSPPTEEMPPVMASLVHTPDAPSATDPRDMYVKLIGRSSAAMNAGKITQDEIAAICNKYGAPSLPMVVNRLDLLPQIVADVDALIARIK